MLGNPGCYDELPYFFTDQYDLGMEYVGHAPRYDSVVFRGDVDGREFTAFWVDEEDRVLAGMNVNVWEGLDDIKAIIRSGAKVDTDRLADPKCHCPNWSGPLVSRPAWRCRRRAP